MGIRVRGNLKMLATATCMAVLLAMSGCRKDVYDPGAKDDKSVFDFSTRSSYTLNVKYDVPEGYQVGFQVYAEDPEKLDADGQVVKKDIDPVDVGFTDKNGAYSQKIRVPATAKFLYIYSTYAGVPRVLVAKVNGDVLSDATYPNEVEGSRSVRSRAGDDYKNAIYNTIVNGNLGRLGFWKNSNGEYKYPLKGVDYDLYGRPDYVLSEKKTISASILNLITRTLPEGGGVDKRLVQDGDIYVKEDANVKLYILDENTSANSTLAYYCYDINNKPKSENDIKDNIVIAFPNAKVLKKHGYSPKGNNGALERGEGITLHYWKDGKDMGEAFPAGTCIGWVVYNQSYSGSNSSNAGLNASAKHFFADGKLNANGKYHVALFRQDDLVVFGFEDWQGEYDYNDVVFSVSANPIEAIIPGIPEVPPVPEEPDDSKVYESVVYRGILAFEDLWPYQGDFDMNDVVVKYVSTVGYNMKNEVVKTTDVYTILWSGAKIDNSFAYQLDVNRGDVDIDITSSLGGNGGAYVDQTLDKATIRLANNVLSYANSKVSKATFTVEANYTKRRIAKGDFTLPPYNPFITTDKVDKEVHLTNARPTDKLDKALLGFGHDLSQPDRNLYYITYDKFEQQMPFAIDLAFEKQEALESFVIPEEMRHIDIYYPKFLNWIKTDGKEDADWYLHPQK